MATLYVSDSQGAVYGNGDDGAPYEAPPMADRALQVSGVFGAGGTLVLEGTIDGVNWAVLNDPQGNALTITSSKIEQIMELVVSVRPRVSSDCSWCFRSPPRQQVRRSTTRLTPQANLPPPSTALGPT